MKKRTILILSALLVIALVLVTMSLRKSGKSAKPSWETATIQRGDLNVTITATGELKPIQTVEVGTQVSGVISRLYADYNSYVHKGEVIAELDTRTLKAQVSSANANLEKAKVALAQAERDYNRNKELLAQNAVAQVDYDNAEATYQTDKANVVSAQVDYDRAIVNLNYGTISSPIDGVVISRNVDEGQTVAASFNTPTLFEIATDLKKMKIEASVDEADIGQVKVGQRVTFTVDAFPDDEFLGKVNQIWLKPTEVNNVVTYTVVIDVENPELKLMPGMTANLTIFVSEEKDVLKVASKALTFEPSFEILQKYGKMPAIPGGQHKMNGQGAMMPPAMNTEAKGDETIMGRIWLLKNDTLVPLRVKKGLGDGMFYEITSPKIKEGDTIVTGINQTFAVTSSSQARSPFMPGRPGATRTSR